MTLETLNYNEMQDRERIARAAGDLAAAHVDIDLYAFEVINETIQSAKGTSRAIHIVISRATGGVLLCAENITTKTEMQDFFNTWRVLDALFDNDDNLIKQYTGASSEEYRIVTAAQAFIIDQMAQNLSAIDAEEEAA